MLWHSAYGLGQISQHLVIKIKPNILWVKGEGGGGEGIEMVSVRGGWGFYANSPMGTNTVSPPPHHQYNGRFRKFLN